MAGRPKIKINEDVLNAMLEYGATCMDCAGKFSCSEDTIVNWLKKHKKMNFSEYSNKMMYKVRMKLREKMFNSAMSGNTAIMIFLAKNLLGMSDDGNKNVENNQPITINYNIGKKPDDNIPKNLT